jgi:hypothetical protein
VVVKLDKGSHLGFIYVILTCLDWCWWVGANAAIALVCLIGRTEKSLPQVDFIATKSCGVVVIVNTIIII